MKTILLLLVASISLADVSDLSLRRVPATDYGPFNATPNLAKDAPIEYSWGNRWHEDRGLAAISVDYVKHSFDMLEKQHKLAQERKEKRERPERVKPFVLLSCISLLIISLIAIATGAVKWDK